MAAAPISRGKSKVKTCPERSRMGQNVKLERKNSPISYGTCGHSLLYSCRECSTNRPIFMQNKANFRKSQMDVKLNITRDYEEKMHWTFGENKPKQSQSFDFAQSLP
jgi:hypothetical protein